jgi:hypothetical protein
MISITKGGPQGPPFLLGAALLRLSSGRELGTLVRRNFCRHGDKGDVAMNTLPPPRAYSGLIRGLTPCRSIRTVRSAAAGSTDRDRGYGYWGVC